MKIGIIGVGVVGKAIKNGFEDFHEIFLHDPKLGTMLEDVTENTNFAYIAVPTPSDPETGECDTSIIKSVLERLPDGYNVVIKSTIIPGTTKELQSKFSNLNICCSPEFLRSKTSNYDFQNQDILVIGSENNKLSELVIKQHKDAGIINFIGLSKAKNFNYEDFVDLSKFDVIQEDINLLSLEPLKKIKQKQNILMARSPLASGLLSGNITNKTIFPKNDHRSEWLYGKRLESLVKRTDEIKKLSGIKLSELSMRFLFSQKEIDKVIFGVKTKEHVKNIIFNSTRERLEEVMVEKLFKLYKEDFGLIDESEYVY